MPTQAMRKWRRTLRSPLYVMQSLLKPIMQFILIKRVQVLKTTDKLIWVVISSELSQTKIFKGYATNTEWTSINIGNLLKNMLNRKLNKKKLKLYHSTRPTLMEKQSKLLAKNQSQTKSKKSTILSSDTKKSLDIRKSNSSRKPTYKAGSSEN